MKRPWPGLHATGILLLIVVTALWGTTFAVIKTTVDTVSPSALVLLRFLLAAIVLTTIAGRQRLPWRRGLELGFWLWIGYASQAHGLQFTTAGRSAFITSVSVVLVAAFVGLLGRRLAPAVWLAAGMALAGVTMLTFDGALPNKGDLWTAVTAVSYAWFVVRLERHVAGASALPLAAAQAWGVVPFAAGWLLLEVVSGRSPAWPSAGPAWLALGYLSLVATACAVWLQTEGQRRVSAPEAAVIYSLEPVWAAAFAAWMLQERLGTGGLAGAALVVLAVLVSQWPGLRRAPAGREQPDAGGSREPVARDPSEGASWRVSVGRGRSDRAPCREPGAGPVPRDPCGS